MGERQLPSRGFVEPLTQREQAILQHLAAGMTYREIAKQEVLALNTVKWYVQQVYGKLGVNNRRQAQVRARDMGLITAELPASQNPNKPAHLSMNSLPTGTVTFLFTDIVGSTPLWEGQPDRMAESLEIHNTALRGAIEAHGGAVFKTVGDAFQAAFSTAPQALQAAIEGQLALHAAPWNELGELKVRMGLNTGEAALDPGGDEYAVSHTKNRAARIMSAAHGGQVLVSQETADLVRRVLPEGVALKDLGEHRLKGMSYLEHLHQVCAPGLERDFPSLSTYNDHPNNLPLELTPFIGRQHLIREVQAMLRAHRLVTLTGSGGVGKTRLSIQATRGMLNDFSAGIWFVELASTSDPNLVPKVVANVLGLREEPNRPILETLCDFLHQRNLLLVLDNCEHLLDACAWMVDTLLKRTSLLKILTSSREALGMDGEYSIRVPSLKVPDIQLIPSLAEVNQSEAVQLFTERARTAMPSFQVTNHNAQAVAQICQRLDGIPLAIALAAARLSILTTEQLAKRLDHAFRLLTGGNRTALPRQQTLRATIDWSYQLLSSPERVLLHRLAVFTGGCTLEGIEAICALGSLEVENILDLLNKLADKSMVEVERIQGCETRYHLLETIRQYAREKLYDSGESESLRNQHLDYFVGLCEEAFPHIHGAGRIEWTERLRLDYGNIRAAMEWAFQDPGSAVPGMRIATSLIDRFWAPLGYYTEQAFWLKVGLEAAGEGIPKHLKAKTYLGFAPEGKTAIEVRQECIALCREVGPAADWELCLALADRSWLIGDLDEAIRSCSEAVEIARKLLPQGTFPLAESLFFYSAHLLLMDIEGKHDDQALAAAQESLAMARLGDRWDVGGYWSIGHIQTFNGQYEQARSSYETALNIFSEANDSIGMIYSLNGLIWVHRTIQQFEQAAFYCQRLFEVADRFGLQYGKEFYIFNLGMLIVTKANSQFPETNLESALMGVRLAAFTRNVFNFNFFLRTKQQHQQELDSLKNKLGQENFSRAWNEGAALSLEEALALAKESNLG